MERIDSNDLRQYRLQHDEMWRIDACHRRQSFLPIVPAWHIAAPSRPSCCRFVFRDRRSAHIGGTRLTSQTRTTPIFHLATCSAAGCAPFPAMLVNDRVYALSAVSSHLRERSDVIEGSGGSMLDVLEHWSENLPKLKAAAAVLANSQPDMLARRAATPDTLQFHSPILNPRQIFCSGANYRRHVVQIIMAQATDATRTMNAQERQAYGEKVMDERARNGTPFFFVKAQSTVTGPLDPIILPKDVEQPDWELELAVVMGRRAHRVTRQEALDYVAGYTIANDLTNRDKLARKLGDMRELGMDWVASKCSATYLPLGPYLVPASQVNDPQSLQITLKLNGEVKQDDNTSDMIFGVARLIEDLSHKVTLLPGDVICTGSPSGNGVHYNRFLRPGDIVESSITGLGTQRNPCIAEVEQ
jgi:2,4-didehydro-3-deoxy-L-rhamnonate hydrolase